MRKYDLNVVVVNYRTPDLVLKCTASVVANGIAPGQDIVIVDNASSDGSAQTLAQARGDMRLVASEVNGGFSAGVNIGAKQCSAKYMLILNPDTYFEDDSVRPAIDLLEARPDVAIVGLDLTYPNGERQYSSRRFYTLLDILARRNALGRFWPLRRRVERHLMVDEWKEERPFAVDWVMGTGFIVRRDTFEQIGGMDEGYFLYMEDVDLCARVRCAGFQVYSVPGARLVHDHQRASAASPLSWAGRIHLSSLRRFREKFRIPVMSIDAKRGILRS